jgi:hypothetical protein
VLPGQESLVARTVIVTSAFAGKAVFACLVLQPTLKRGYFMQSKAVVRSRKASPHTGQTTPGRNSMTFPRSLREAIPAAPGYSGRILELDAIDGKVNHIGFGPTVRLSLAVQETGKLTGKFTVWMDLQPSAARALAATLTRIADRAEPKAGS